MGTKGGGGVDDGPYSDKCYITTRNRHGRTTQSYQTVAQYELLQFVCYVQGAWRSPIHKAHIYVLSC